LNLYNKMKEYNNQDNRDKMPVGTLEIKVNKEIVDASRVVVNGKNARISRSCIGLDGLYPTTNIEALKRLVEDMVSIRYQRSFTEVILGKKEKTLVELNYHQGVFFSKEQLESGKKAENYPN